MSLLYEYFKNKTHIEDLQKLKDDKLYPIIQELQKELEKLTDIKTTQLKDLKKLCDEITEIIKYIRLILISYKGAYYEEMNNHNNRKRENINDLIYEMDTIELLTNDLKNLKINTNKVNKLTYNLLIFIRLLSYTINELNDN